MEPVKVASTPKWSYTVKYGPHFIHAHVPSTANRRVPHGSLCLFKGFSCRMVTACSAILKVQTYDLTKKHKYTVMIFIDTNIQS